MRPHTPRRRLRDDITLMLGAAVFAIVVFSVACIVVVLLVLV